MNTKINAGEKTSIIRVDLRKPAGIWWPKKIGFGFGSRFTKKFGRNSMTGRAAEGGRRRAERAQAPELGEGMPPALGPSAAGE